MKKWSGSLLRYSHLEMRFRNPNVEKIAFKNWMSKWKFFNMFITLKGYISVSFEGHKLLKVSFG